MRRFLKECWAAFMQGYRRAKLARLIRAYGDAVTSTRRKR